MIISAIDELKSYLSQLREEDLVWALYVYNHPNIHYHCNSRDDNNVLEKDIEEINSLNKLKDIINLIINKMENQYINNIYDYLRDLDYFKSNFKIISQDLNRVKNNKRFLQFACKVMSDGLRERLVLDIKNLYFQFLYMAFTFPRFYENPRSIEAIYNKFDRIYSKFNNHFKFSSADFYIWAKNYINENQDFRGYNRYALNASEYELLINSIFDIIYDENENIHYALRKKLSNAWYQKKHREENKVKKPNYYALTKRAKESLQTLAFKNGVSEEQMIERLINETYVKKCCSVHGENLYL